MKFNSITTAMKFKLRETKIQRIGYSFYTTLPIEWVNNNNLRKGSQLQANLDENGRLILEPKDETVPS